MEYFCGGVSQNGNFLNPKILGSTNESLWKAGENVENGLGSHSWALLERGSTFKQDCISEHQGSPVDGFRSPSSPKGRFFLQRAYIQKKK